MVASVLTDCVNLGGPPPLSGPVLEMLGIRLPHEK